MDPVADVQAAFHAGASTRKDIALATGMHADVIDAVVDVLIRTGGMEVHRLRFECGAGGCGNCVQDSSCAPVPVTLRAPAGAVFGVASGPVARHL